MRPKKPERCASSAARSAAAFGPPAGDVAGASTVSFRRTKYRLSVGVQVSARRSEVKRETVMVTARARKKLPVTPVVERSEEHTSELQSLAYLVCRLLLEKKKKTQTKATTLTLIEST